MVILSLGSVFSNWTMSCLAEQSKPGPGPAPEPGPETVAEPGPAPEPGPGSEPEPGPEPEPEQRTKRAEESHAGLHRNARNQKRPRGKQLS